MKLFEIKLLMEDETEEGVKKTLKDLGLKYSEISVAKSRRTIEQNSALWLLFTQLANEMNIKGIDMRELIRKEVPLSWTAYNINEFLWKPLLKALTGKKSTTKMSKTEDIDLVYDNLNRILIERTNGEISLPPFPSLDSMLDK